MGHAPYRSIAGTLVIGRTKEVRISGNRDDYGGYRERDIQEQ